MFNGMKKKKKTELWRKRSKAQKRSSFLSYSYTHFQPRCSLLGLVSSTENESWLDWEIHWRLFTSYPLPAELFPAQLPFKKSISERQRNRKLSYTHLRNGQRSKGKDFLIANIDKRNASVNLFTQGPCSFLPSWNPPQFFSCSEIFLLWHWTFSVPLLPFWLVLCCLLLGVPKYWVLPLINGVPCDFIHPFIHLRNTYQKSVMY